MYIGEVGGNQQNLAHDDLHLAGLDQKGAFYGWPFYEGTPNTYVNGGAQPAEPEQTSRSPTTTSPIRRQGDFYSAPIWSLPHNGVGASLTGGEVYRGDMFPAEWDGVYFYGDYTRDYIRYLVLDETGTQVLGDFAFKPSAAAARHHQRGGLDRRRRRRRALLCDDLLGRGAPRRLRGANVAPEIVATSLIAAARATCRSRSPSPRRSPTPTATR